MTQEKSSSFVPCSFNSRDFSVVTRKEQKHLPCVDGARLGERDAELGAALHFADPESLQRVDLHRHLAAVRPAAPQLAIVAVAPRPDRVVVRDAQSLGVAAATRDVHHAEPLECLHLHKDASVLKYCLAILKLRNTKNKIVRARTFAPIFLCRLCL